MLTYGTKNKTNSPHTVDLYLLFSIYKLFKINYLKILIFIFLSIYIFIPNFNFKR